MGSFKFFATLAHIPWQDVLHTITCLLEEEKEIVILKRKTRGKEVISSHVQQNFSWWQWKERNYRKFTKEKIVKFNLPKYKISYLEPGLEIWLLTFNMMLSLALQMDR